MKKLKAVSFLALIPLALSLLVHTGAAATEPMLARLSFWAPPERMAEFEVAYEKQVLPLLREQGAVESSRRSRATSDSVFSRLFELPSLAEFEERNQPGPRMLVVLKQLGTTFGTTDDNGLIRVSFTPYDRPVGPGQTVAAGPGRGHWRTYDMSDGLPNVGIRAILQDRDGHLWFGTEPPEDLPYIFEEFRQVERQGDPEKEGTGLGLAIAKKSVELLGGTITAESEVGRGTTFAMRIEDYETKGG